MRKALGGGMRQSGVVAAAALEGLRKQLPRLSDDHANAKKLAQVRSSRRCACFGVERMSNVSVVACLPSVLVYCSLYVSPPPLFSG